MRESVLTRPFFQHTAENQRSIYLAHDNDELARGEKGESAKNVRRKTCGASIFTRQLELGGVVGRDMS